MTVNVTTVAIALVGALVSVAVRAEDVCTVVDGAVLIAQDDDNTYLGKVDNKYDSDSIFNDFGTYGNQYNSSSIWNQYATFGSQYSTFSPTNSMTSTPPMIIKNKSIIGYLTTNKNIKPSISPNLLKAMCKDAL